MSPEQAAAEAERRDSGDGGLDDAGQVIRSMPLHDLEGKSLMCEEYARMNQDFCRWTTRPHQLPRWSAVMLDDEFGTPVTELYRWTPAHWVLVLGFGLYLWYCGRYFFRHRGGGGGSSKEARELYV